MKINNIKPNLRQFLTDKIKTQKINLQNVAISNKTNNFIKQINSHNNSNKNIGKLSLLNSIKDKESKKIITSKNNNNINSNNKNFNYNFNNNSFYKENQNDYNKFRKSKTSEKINGNIILTGYQQQNKNNKNKKIMIKQNTGKMKKYNLSISKIPKYDNSAFNQVIKYYTIKSESKTIQVEELSAYLRPIRNILGFANKIKTQSNISSSININSHYNNKKYIINNTNNLNKEKENSEEEMEDIKKNDKEKDNGNNDNNDDNNNNVNNDNINNEEKNFNIINNEDMDKDTNDMTFGKNKNIQSDINLNENKDKNDINEQNKINNNLNKINTSLIKNCVFNNISHTQRNNKFSPISFNIKIDKINDINISTIKNINTSNNIDKNKEIKTQSNTTNNNIINSKNTCEIETQISTNNNVNNKQKESLAFYQFRPRKMNLPKTGINLSSLHFNNKILLNILNKKKQNK